MSGTFDESNGEPARPSNPIEFTEAESEVLMYLRDSKRVDLRWLSAEQKLKIRTVLDRLHNDKKISLFRISKEVGRSYTAIWGLCRTLQIHTRNVAEADRESAESRSKHKRKSFDGTQEQEDYILGFRHGDLTAWQVSGTAVMVTSTTTHPKFAKLFRELFENYGHVYEYPMYEEEGYKWKVAVRLDNSFQFLLRSAEETVKSLAANRRAFLSWLAGLVDADGSIYFTNNANYVRICLSIGITKPDLLKSILSIVTSLGYKANGPYLAYKAGVRTPLGIVYINDLWRIYFQRSEETQQLLRELPIRHSEKIAQKELAISLNQPTKWTDVEAKARGIRQQIEAETDQFVERAKQEYLKRKSDRRLAASLEKKK
jgi:hypothetical protein